MLDAEEREVSSRGRLDLLLEQLGVDVVSETVAVGVTQEANDVQQLEPMLQTMAHTLKAAGIEDRPVQPDGVGNPGLGHAERGPHRNGTNWRPPRASTALRIMSVRLGINSSSASDFELVTWVAIMEPYHGA